MRGIDLSSVLAVDGLQLLHAAYLAYARSKIQDFLFFYDFWMFMTILSSSTPIVINI